MTDFIILILAIWRLSYMLVYERGPFAIFDRWRDLIRIKEVEMTTQTSYGEFKEKKRAPTNELGQLFVCIYCLSIWIAPLLWLAWQTEAGRLIVTWLALSGGALVVQGIVRFGRD